MKSACTATAAVAGPTAHWLCAGCFQLQKHTAYICDIVTWHYMLLFFPTDLGVQCQCKTKATTDKQSLCVDCSPVEDAKLLPAHHSGSAGLAPLHPEAAGSVGEEIRTSLLKHERKQTGPCWGAAWPPALPFPTNHTTAAAAAAVGLHIHIH